MLYYPYSQYLKDKYGEKVYKLPVNLPITCPNRQNSSGCTFCAESGTGFEAMDSQIPVIQQLEDTKEYIEKRYNAHKFIAYFQNYTNTYMPLQIFKERMLEAAKCKDIVQLSISTRPDCIRDSYLQVLSEIQERYKVEITIELGLQTANYHTLLSINRGHTLAEFIDAVMKIKTYGFEICAHVILNLPGDNIIDVIETAKILSAMKVSVVKAHSLYIAKNTPLCEAYENGTISLCEKEEYLHRLMMFLEYLDPHIAVERLFSRIPENEAVFCNWGTSWWKLKDELIALMEQNDSFQGKSYHYLDGVALRTLDEEIK